MAHHMDVGKSTAKHMARPETNDVYATESIGAVGTIGKKWFVNLQLKGKLKIHQLDSGATCNAMSFRDKKRLAPREKLKPSVTMLRLYSDRGLPSLGPSLLQSVLYRAANTNWTLRL